MPSPCDAEARGIPQLAATIPTTKPHQTHHNGRRSTSVPLPRAPGSSAQPQSARPAGSLARNGTRSLPDACSKKKTNMTCPQQRSAALKLDWTKLGTQLGLKGNTAVALQSFKKRNDDARRKVIVLSEQPQTVDFSYYRSILKNQAIVDDIEKQFNAFKPVTYDVGRQIKAIEAFEAQAVKSAEETKAVVDKELSDLQKTLTNIQEARPFSDLTVVRTWRFGVAGRGGLGLMHRVRTRLRLLSQRLTSAPSSSWQRVAGPFQVTRQVSAWSASCVGPSSLIPPQEKFGDLSVL